jgi:hypothetical protein
VTRKELSAITAEAAALTERAAARTEIARAGIEEATAEQRKAVARQESIAAEIKKLTPQWEKERAAFREWFRESKRNTDKILVELREGRDERRAMLEALFRVMDRLPPPPPNLRSA